MNKFFNAHHSPVGSYSSFTLGFKGEHGGLGNMLGKPADQEIFIGYSTSAEEYKLMPFFNDKSEIDIDNFTEDPVFEKSNVKISTIPDEQITRNFNIGTDEFRDEKLSFKIITPHMSIPEVEGENQKLAITPSLVTQITFTNDSSEPQQVIFGFKRNNKSSSLRHADKPLVGIIDGLETAVICNDNDSKSVVHFTLADALNKTFQNNAFNRKFMLGEIGLIVTDIAPNTTKTITYTVNFYVDGTITSGIRTKFKYTDYFQSIEEVAAYTLSNYEQYILEALKADEKLNNENLEVEKKFQIAHAVKSYYGSSQFLTDGVRNYHIVNEGEYQMMQTFDLMIDHLFFELEKNSWVIKNNLELFIDQFMYNDKIKYEDKVIDAGISFAHDMGNINQFSLGKRSSYELEGLTGCFSHMSYEQLTNFIITALTYSFKVEDTQFMKDNLKLFELALESILIKDHPIEEFRTGVFSFDSTRVGSGKEITTYDSLDVSLGQAAENTYIASKTYAALCLLNEYFEKMQIDKQDIIDKEIKLMISQVEKYFDGEKIPALLDSGSKAYIIPVVEGLAYLRYLRLEKYYTLDCEYSKYIEILKIHTDTVLSNDYCLFENGGYRLSSTSKMTWLSKIYLAQYVHENVFNVDPVIIRKSNVAHTEWLLDEKLSYWAWSDQILNYKIKGSKYYPRGVTSILWTDK